MVAARTARIGAGLLGLGLVGVVLLYPTDEKRARAAAEALVIAANAGSAELATALETYAEPTVAVSVSELGSTFEGREALVSALGQAEQLGQKLRFRAEAVEVAVEGSRARVSADLITAAGPELPELRRPRHASALLQKRAGQFRLLSLEIGSERRDQPEARP